MNLSHDPEPNPNLIVVPTNDPGATEAEYVALGWTCCDLFSKRFNPDLCQGKLWAIRFWRPEPPQQPELL